jgi:hypothetical protein
VERRHFNNLFQGKPRRLYNQPRVVGRHAHLCLGPSRLAQDRCVRAQQWVLVDNGKPATRSQHRRYGTRQG